MKYTVCLLTIALVGLANCKKVDDPNAFPAEFSAGDTYIEDGKYVIEEPMLWQMPVLAKNASLTAEHICDLLGKGYKNHRDATQIKKLKKAVDGVFMGHDQFGRSTGIEYGKQDEILGEMYCEELLPEGAN